MLCTKMFLPFSDLNNNEFKQTVIGKQVKFIHIAKPAIYNAENFIQAVNSENNITKYFTIKGYLRSKSIFCYKVAFDV